MGLICSSFEEYSMYIIDGVINYSLTPDKIESFFLMSFVCKRLGCSFDIERKWMDR